MEEMNNVNVTKEENEESFITKHKYDIMLIAGIGLLSLINFRLGFKKGYSKAVKEGLEAMDENTKDILKRICPEEHVKYVVERTGEFSGTTFTTYDDYVANDPLIKNVIAGVIEHNKDKN